MKNNQFQVKGFVVWGVCALFFMYEFLLRTVVGTYQQPIMHDLGLTFFQFSLISTTLFLLFYGIMQVPVGIIVDNIGLKKSLLVAIFVCTLSALGFAYSSNFYMAVFFRVIMGFGASFGFICLLISVYDWMPHRYSAVFIGLSQFIGTMGPMMAAGPLDALSESQGISWRVVFLGLFVVGIILTLLIFFFVENNKERAGDCIVLHRPEKIYVSIKRLFARIQPWYIAILSMCVYFTVEYLTENEGRAFLSLKGMSFSVASYMITFAWIGYAVGCPLLGFLSDFFQRRKIIMIFGAFLGLVSIVGVLYSFNKEVLFLSFFALGFGASSQSVGFAAIAEQFKKQFVAIGFGLNNAIIVAFSAINAPLIGKSLDFVRKGAEVSLSNYLLVFSILIVMFFIAVIVSIFFIKETYCKSAVDFTYLSGRG